MWAVYFDNFRKTPTPPCIVQQYYKQCNKSIKGYAYNTATSASGLTVVFGKVGTLAARAH